MRCKRWCADFETTTNPDDCRVWAWAVVNIDDENEFYIGTKIDEFIAQFSGSNQVYFHNLKFDGEFILSFILKSGWKYTNEKHPEPFEFNSLINENGAFYSIKMSTGNAVIEFRDSLKLINYSVGVIADKFETGLKKLDIDYLEDRGLNHTLTQQEVDYITNDVKIVARALKKVFGSGALKLTQAAAALTDYKEIIGKNNFDRLFPKTDDTFIRRSYKGGYTYLHPNYTNRLVTNGLVLDVNSLYPYVMHECPLPYGAPKYFKGKYKDSKIYPLFVQRFKCGFELKDNMLPTIQIKHSIFNDTEYLQSSNCDVVEMTLTSVDLELFLSHYDVYMMEYIDGYEFRATDTLFKQYVDKWTKVKIDSQKEGNMAMRNWAKIMLNSLYGKFAVNPKGKSKIPYLDDKGIVKYRLGPEEERKMLYIPIGTFITAWARYHTITTAQKIIDYSIEKYGKNMYVYSDTDSIHTTMPEEDLAKIVHIDEYVLGAWKVEERFTKGKYLRAKTYLHEYEGKQSVKCAGMPEKLKLTVNWDNFTYGSRFAGKLVPKHVPGGILLTETDFTIKRLTLPACCASI